MLASELDNQKLNYFHCNPPPLTLLVRSTLPHTLFERLPTLPPRVHATSAYYARTKASLFYFTTNARPAAPQPWLLRRER